jgi:NADP-dependent 3-hydroxy acid dehydrogenase YdfG
MQAFVEFAKDKFGRVDVVVNNAGLMPLAKLEALKIDEWNRMADAIARTIAFAIEQPADVDVNEIVVRPIAQIT